MYRRQTRLTCSRRLVPALLQLGVAAWQPAGAVQAAAARRGGPARQQRWLACGCKAALCRPLPLRPWPFGLGGGCVCGTLSMLAGPVRLCAWAGGATDVAASRACNAEPLRLAAGQDVLMERGPGWQLLGLPQARPICLPRIADRCQPMHPARCTSSTPVASTQAWLPIPTAPRRQLAASRGALHVPVASRERLPASGAAGGPGADMAAAAAESPAPPPAATERELTFTNPRDERLVGLLVDTGSDDVVILCHGWAAGRREQGSVARAPHTPLRLWDACRLPPAPWPCRLLPLRPLPPPHPPQLRGQHVDVPVPAGGRGAGGGGGQQLSIRPCLRHLQPQRAAGALSDGQP